MGVFRRYFNWLILSKKLDFNINIFFWIEFSRVDRWRAFNEFFGKI